MFTGKRHVLFSAGQGNVRKISHPTFPVWSCRLNPVGAQKPQVFLFHSVGYSLLGENCVSFFSQGCNSLSE